MKHKITILIITFATVSACQREENYQYTLTEQDSIQIPIEDYVNPSSESIDFFSDSTGNHLLYLTSNVLTKRNEILNFNLTTKKVKKRFYLKDQMVCATPFTVLTSLEIGSWLCLPFFLTRFTLQI